MEQAFTSQLSPLLDIQLWKHPVVWCWIDNTRSCPRDHHCIRQSVNVYLIRNHFYRTWAPNYRCGALLCFRALSNYGISLVIFYKRCFCRVESFKFHLSVVTRLPFLIFLTSHCKLARWARTWCGRRVVPWFGIGKSSPLRKCNSTMHMDVVHDVHGWCSPNIQRRSISCRGMKLKSWVTAWLTTDHPR